VPAPNYTQSSIVHAATNQPRNLAPNTIATIYGVNLATSTRGVHTSDIRHGKIPDSLAGTGTSLLVGGINAPIYYASPTQVNFLVPADVVPGTTRLTVVVSGISGPSTEIRIIPAAPGLFLASATTPAAVNLAGSLISPESPAVAGSWVILYATGLGATVPRTNTGEIAMTAVPLAALLRVWLGNRALTPAYAGLAPGYAGLYQINVLIPADAPNDPEVRVEVDGVLSPAGVYLPLRKPN
jgi:uncharacterized protein (TIGR03437 family)